MMIIDKLSPLTRLKRRLKFKLFKLTTKNALGIFLRGGDIISRGPLVEGVHERHIEKLIFKLTKNGFCDFFIDIGANIGISSCQSGGFFKKVYCFEPNPLCFNVLKTNLLISLNSGVSEAYNFALGDHDGVSDLYIPKHNWGGAFLMDGNDYPEDVLGKKDGFEKIKPENYIITQARTVDSINLFRDLFSNLNANRLTKGVIKIDVEGFERKILLAIARTLPKNLNVAIVFENWNPEFDFSEIEGAFGDSRISFNKFAGSVSKIGRAKISRYLRSIFLSETISLVEMRDGEVSAGDVVLFIGSQ